MALVNCPECEKEISDKAPVCPNCGYQIKSKRQWGGPNIDKKAAIGILFIISIGIICVFILGNAFWGLNKNEKLLLNCTKMIQEDLLDPSSIIIYEATIYHCTPEDSEELFINADEGKVLVDTLVYIHYGARTKGGGIADGEYVFRKDKDGVEKIKESSSKDINSWIYNIYFDQYKTYCSEFGIDFSEESIEKVLKKI